MPYKTARGDPTTIIRCFARVITIITHLGKHGESDGWMLARELGPFLVTLVARCSIFVSISHRILEERERGSTILICCFAYNVPFYFHFRSFLLGF